MKEAGAIGTGITEAAAKTVVGTRIKRAGARFSQHGGQAVMPSLNALLSSRLEASVESWSPPTRNACGRLSDVPRVVRNPVSYAR